MFNQSKLLTKFAFAGVLSVWLTGCGGYKIWPFSSDSVVVDATLPENSTAYHCAGGKKFYVRERDKGQSIWLILPDREFALNKQSVDGMLYSNGVTSLTLGQPTTVLEISPSLKWLDCAPHQPAVSK